MISSFSAPEGWGLFQIVHIIEQYPQAGASGIEVRRCVIGREQHERLEDPEHRCLTGIGQLRKRIPRYLRLSTVAQNHLREINAAAIMAIRGRRPHPTQGSRHEMGCERAVEVALVEIRTEIVALEIRKNVAHKERLSQWQLHRREP